MKDFLNAIVDFFRISKGDRQSLTARAFILGSIIVNIKLLLSGMTVKNMSFAIFSGSDYGMAFGALVAGYSLRNATRQKNEEKKE